jgi:hypothetical protein
MNPQTIAPRMEPNLLVGAKTNMKFVDAFPASHPEANEDESESDAQHGLSRCAANAGVAKEKGLLARGHRNLISRSSGDGVCIANYSEGGHSRRPRPAGC